MNVRDDPAEEALRAWCALPPTTPLADAAGLLLVFPHRVRARAARAALRAALAADDPDPEWQRPAEVLRAVDAWLAAPGEDTLAMVRRAGGAAEQAWNAVAGDRGQPEPTWQAATYAAWVVTEPERPWGVVHTLGGAAKAVGAEGLLQALAAELRGPSR